MDGLSKDKLIKNDVFLNENTGNLPVLLSWLIQEKILDTREKELINFEKTSYDRNAELYNILKTKCPFETLLKCLDNSHNKHIADRLRSTVIIQECHKTKFGLPTTAPVFMGRCEELKRLKELWEASKRANRFTLVSVSGPAGVGKSELVNQFLNLNKGDILGNIIWISVETIQIATESLHQLAKKLYISLWDVDHREKSLATLTTDIFGSLAKPGSIIVLDNLKKKGELIFLKHLTQLHNNMSVEKENIPFLILISRFEPSVQYFGTDLKEVRLSKDIPELDALKYLSTKLQLHLEEHLTQLRKLGHLLEHHPFAIELATSYLLQQRDLPLEVQISNYINIVEKMRETVNSTQQDKEKIPLICFITWKINIHAVIKNNTNSGALAPRLIQEMAFFSLDNISIEILTKLHSCSSKNEKNALENQKIMEICKLLKDYSLCNISQDELSLAPHKLGQQMTRLEMNDNDCQTTHDTLNTLLQSFVDMLKKKAVPINQLCHVISIWKHSTIYKDLLEKYGELPLWICLALFQKGRWEDVFNFSETASEILEREFGSQYRWLLRLYYWKGRIHYQKGLYQKSLKILEDVHGRQKFLFGERDHHTLITAHRIAMVVWKKGNKNEALERLQITLELRERKFGKAHKNTQFLKTDIAEVFWSIQDFGNARSSLEDVYDVREQLLSENHPETLSSKFNLGHLLFRAKQYNEAIAVFKEVKEGRERVLEIDHQDTVRVKHFMALTYKSMGRWRMALPLAEEVYDKRVHLLGMEHPYTNYTRNLVRQLKRLLNEVDSPRRMCR